MLVPYPKTYFFTVFLKESAEKLDKNGKLKGKIQISGSEILFYVSKQEEIIVEHGHPEHASSTPRFLWQDIYFSVLIIS